MRPDPSFGAVARAGIAPRRFGAWWRVPIAIDTRYVGSCWLPRCHGGGSPRRRVEAFYSVSQNYLAVP